MILKPVEVFAYVSKEQLWAAGEAADLSAESLSRFLHFTEVPLVLQVLDTGDVFHCAVKSPVAVDVKTSFDRYIKIGNECAALATVLSGTKAEEILSRGLEFHIKKTMLWVNSLLEDRDDKGIREAMLQLASLTMIGVNALDGEE